MKCYQHFLMYTLHIEYNIKRNTHTHTHTNLHNYTINTLLIVLETALFIAISFHFNTRQHFWYTSHMYWSETGKFNVSCTSTLSVSNISTTTVYIVSPHTFISSIAKHNIITCSVKYFAQNHWWAFHKSSFKKTLSYSDIQIMVSSLNNS